MGYYPNMGVLRTVDGGLYACDKALRAYFDPNWTFVQATEMDIKMKWMGDSACLVLRGDGECMIIWTQNIRCVTFQFILIQKAVRNWLHRRKIPLRQESALFLRATLPDDMVDLVVQALH
jgi:hypothetical protein